MSGMPPGSRVRVLAALLVLVVTGVLVTIWMVPSEQARRVVPRVPVRGSGSPLASDLLIVPGVRVGDVWVGGLIDDVRPMLGQVEIAPRKDTIIYSSAEFDLGVRGDHIEMVVVKTPRFKTKEGLAVGGGITPVIEALGRRYEYTEKKTTPLQYTLDYWERGVSFVTERDVITQVKIFSSVGTPNRN